MTDLFGGAEEGTDGGGEGTGGGFGVIAGEIFLEIEK